MPRPKRLTIDPNRLKSRIKSRQIAHVVHQSKKDTLIRKSKHKQKVALDTENN